MTPMERIASYKIPTTSFVAAAQYVNNNPLLPDEYRVRIAELANADTDMEDDHVRIHYGYLVQETVRSANAGNDVDMKSIFQLATTRAKTFVQKNPWVFAKPEGQTGPAKLDAAGNPKKPKGAKKEMAISLYKKMVMENNGKHPARKDAIEMFVKEVGMTPAGASTYVANCKKNFGKSW